MPRRYLLFLLLGLMATLARGADNRAEEIGRIHLAAIGGAERIKALSSVRATGRVTVDKETVRFTMLAQRPNRVRMEYAYPTGTLIQATDGIHPPWEIDGRRRNAHSALMADLAAQSFLADADFDDPLVATGNRHNEIEYAGNVTIDGRPLLRLLVTRNLSSSFFLFVDSETYFIVRRLDPKPAVGLDHADVVTEYSNFLPVAGVLTPYSTIVRENGNVIQEATIDAYEANPTLAADTFTRPAP